MQNKTFLTHYSDLLSFRFTTKKSVLIADSGGTKTDWCLIARKTLLFFFNGILPSQYAVLPFKIRTHSILERFNAKLAISCHFYGAGCSTEENKSKIKNYFTKEANFIHFEIASDLVAAGIALLGKEEGYVGILGTGSVLTYYQNRQITDIIGGFGYLLGDEGSGYYFGKLVLQKYLNKELSEALTSLLETQYGNRSSILKNCYSPEGKAFICSIQIKSDSEIIQREINLIHQENIELFLSTYLPKKTTQKEISFVGSYAFYQRELLKSALEKLGWELRTVIQKPIEKLAVRVTSDE